MSKRRGSISQSRSYQEIGDYWSRHDLAEVWDQTEPVEVEVAIRTEKSSQSTQTAVQAAIKETKE
jgi:hypothetical protein